MRLPFLEASLRAALLREALRRLLAWAALALVLYSAATALFLLLSPPVFAATGLLLALLSFLPAFLLWPAPEGELAAVLRKVDEDTTIEAFLGAPEGPARALLAERALAVDKAIEWKSPSRGGFFRGLWPLLLAAGIALTLLELTALLVLSHPLLAYSGPPEAASSGLRIEERPFLPAGNPEERGAPVADTRQAAPGTRPGDEIRRSRAEDEADFRGLEQGPAVAGAEAAQGGAPDAAKQAGRNGASATGEEGGTSLTGGQKGDQRAKGGSPQASGFEASQGLLPRSPLVDYRARIFQALTGSGSEAPAGSAAGEGMDLGRLGDFERRYFSSFVLGAGTLPREDAYTSLLKQRWRENAGRPR
jgi:hypothetical protein